MCAAVVELLATESRGEALVIAFNLWRSVKLRSWDECGGVSCLHQIDGVDTHTAASLEFTGVRTLRQLARAEPERLKQCIGRDLRFCSSLIENAASITDFSASVAVQDGSIRIAVMSSRPRFRGALERQDGTMHSCALLAWTPDQLLVFREGLQEGAVLEVQIPKMMDKKRRVVTIQLYHEQFAGMDQRLEVPLDQGEQQRAWYEDEGKTSPTATDILASEALPEALDGESNMLKAIKKLERHHKSAKQQSMFQYLCCVPDSGEAAIQPIVARNHPRLNDAIGKHPGRSTSVQQPKHFIMARDPDTVHSVASQLVATDTEKSCRDRVDDCLPLHVVPPDDQFEVENIAIRVQAKRPECHQVSHRKRKVEENLFAHFRFKKKSTAPERKLATSAVLGDKPKKPIKDDSFVLSAARPQCYHSASARPKTQSTKIRGGSTLSTTPAPASSISSSPFFEAFLREKVRGSSMLLSCCVVEEFTHGTSAARVLGCFNAFEPRIPLLNAFDRRRSADAPTPSPV